MQSFDKRMEVCSAGTEPAPLVNPLAIKVMKEAGIDISHNQPKSVNAYLNEPWDYVITVCGGANESCPAFTGHVKHRLHIGFNDPSRVEGTSEFILTEFHRVRDAIRDQFYKLYSTEIKDNI